MNEKRAEPSNESKGKIESISDLQDEMQALLETLKRTGEVLDRSYDQYRSSYEMVINIVSGS